MCTCVSEKSLLKPSISIRHQIVMDFRIQIKKHKDSDSHIEMIEDAKEEDGDSIVSDLPHEDSALLVQFQGSSSDLKTRMVKSFSVPKSISSQSKKIFCTDAVKVIFVPTETINWC